MSQKPFNPTPRTLMGPGPSDVYPRVLAAMARPTIGHLDPQFIQLMDEVKALLQFAFQTKNELTIPISAPGSAGMEACIVNLLEAGEKAIVCQNGVFGGRLAEIVRRAGGEAIVVQGEWGRAVDPDAVAKAFRQHPDAVLLAFVHAETSTGARSDPAVLCRMARENGSLSVVDCVTSLGGIEVEVDAWSADAVYSGTQKCLSCVPGLSPITMNERCVQKIKNRKQPVRSWFLDLGLIMEYWGQGVKRAYHHTAPINTIYALHEALVVLKEEGLSQSWNRHRRNHLALKAGLEAMGLTFIVPEQERLPQLNAVTVPEGVDEASIRRKLLEEFNLEIGAGLGVLAGKVWRIGLMGHACRPANVLLCLAALESVLAESNAPISKGVAIAAAQAAYGRHE